MIAPASRSSAHVAPRGDTQASSKAPFVGTSAPSFATRGASWDRKKQNQSDSRDRHRQGRRHASMNGYSSLQRSGSYRSMSTEGSAESVYFSTTKLGKLLQSKGFHVEKDFEVGWISPEVVASTDTSVSKPTAPRRSFGCSTQISPMSCSSGGTTTVTMRNDVIETPPDLGKQKIVTNFGSSHGPKRDTDMAKMKGAKTKGHQAQRKLQVNSSVVGRDDKPPLPRNPKTRSGEYAHLVYPVKARRGRDPPPSNYGSDCSPTSCSDDSTSWHDDDVWVKPVPRVLDDSALTSPDAAVPPTIDDPSSGRRTEKLLSEAPSFEEDFVPLAERPSVEELQRQRLQKAAERKSIIDKMKSMESRLSSMLSACHDAARRLKEVEEDSITSDCSDALSDISLLHG